MNAMPRCEFARLNVARTGFPTHFVIGAGARDAQGIEAEFSRSRENWSGKPGVLAHKRQNMRPKYSAVFS
jgi:hypothetical protein